MSVIEFALRAALTATFLLSAAGKTVARHSTERMLRELLPPNAAPMTAPVTISLIAAEVLTAVAVATADDGVRADIGLGAVLALALAFTVASVLGLRRGDVLTCACFGTFRPVRALGWHTLARAGVIAAAAAGWRLALAAVPATSADTADRAGLSFVTAAAVASAIAWNHWRHGIAHRRFAADATYLYQLTSQSRRSRAST